MGVSRAFLRVLVPYLNQLRGCRSIAVIGDQDVRVSTADLHRHGVTQSEQTGERLSLEGLMRCFDIEGVTTFDLNGSPDVRIDLAQPIPMEHAGCYECVVDLGTLEHIIDPFQALSNFDSMLKVEGLSYI